MLAWVGLSRTTYGRVLQNKVSIDYDYDNGDSLMIIIMKMKHTKKNISKYMVKNGQILFGLQVVTLCLGVW